MSDYASSSSRPGSPVGELPNIPSARPYRFAWDAATKRPGPRSISETTEGRGDYFVANASAPFDELNTSSLSLALGAMPPEWSSSTHGFHAISTVVNNPHKRSAPPKAHSSIPIVPAADLPRVRRKDFDAYLRSVAPEWERFEANAQQGREGAAKIDQISLPERNDTSDVPQTPRTPRPPPGKALTPLESVPSIFFGPKFNLGDPRTFDTITEGGGEGGADYSDPSSLSYSQPLLDRLSHHADTIEQHLVREISLRSTSFFAALSNLQDLQTESEQCLDRISKLRALLKDVDEKGAKRGLEIVRLECKLRNVCSARESLKVVGGVIEMTGVAKGLVAAGQWSEALNVVDELEALWNAHSSAEANGHQSKIFLAEPGQENGSLPLATVPESPPQSPAIPDSTSKTPSISVPLSSLQAFASLPSHLRALTMEIASSLTSELVNILRLDLIERIDVDAPGATRQEGIQMSLKDRLRPLLHSLVRTGGLREVTESWREVVMSEVHNTVKRRTPLFDLEEEDPTTPKGTESAKQLRSMDQATFMDLAHVMYKSFLSCIEGFQAQSNVVLDVLEAIHQPKVQIDMPALREELADILSSAGELANSRASKVINVRTEQHTGLGLEDFWILFTVSWDFVVKSEIICRRMIVGLRGVVVSQAKSFLQAYHQTRLSQSAKLVEDEQWNPAEVPPPMQRIVDMLVEASIQDPPSLLLGRSPPPPASPLPPSSPLLSPPPTTNLAPFQPSSPLPSPAFPLRTQTNGTSPRRSGGSSGKHLKIEDRPFFAVSATLEVLTLLVDYLKVIMNLSMLTTDTMSRVIELMKAFNSRTCQVVLGAGAMRSAGLKNITAKHLALASQSISIMISLIPYVRETFRRHLSQKQAVMLIEFDKLKRDYQEHQNEIHAKLIAIMGDRLSAHIRTLQAVRWDVSKESDGVNDYMELLVKETVTLHKVLSRYLSPSIVEYVMSQVFAAINHRLSEEYTKIELPSREAKDRLLADARYLQQKLSGLKNVAAPPGMLELVVSEKIVARKVAPPATSRIKGMLGRTDSLKHKAPTPAADVEKALPVLSPSPIPASVRASPSPSPTPTVATPENATAPNGRIHDDSEKESHAMSSSTLSAEQLNANGSAAADPLPPPPPKSDSDGMTIGPTGLASPSALDMAQASQNGSVEGGLTVPDSASPDTRGQP